ncbi:hypothetical protein F5Y16DRAFT_89424 [Xylariaceae sp. FL0255]|nr:hypothetical protein F5Y16DRAFT_89424 [Xylariaceae sp. FL0255]
MKPKRYHGLKRPKLRQSWNKYNLYNLFTFRAPRIGSYGETFFQQKWKAKGLMRNYHGEHIVESKWERMFSRRLLSVVNMDPSYMAKNDGSEMAEGRGSGKDRPPNWNNPEVRKRTATPYMQMTFAPMERRLDIAVFRAMFASSVRQARQYCVHGAVKVNGKKMPWPAYRLNPGDMFQVDPERVLYAAGRPKFGERREKPSLERRRLAFKNQFPGTKGEEAAEVAEGEREGEASESSAAPAESAVDPRQDPDTVDPPEPEPVDYKPVRSEIMALIAQAKAAVQEPRLSANAKRTLRAFNKEAKAMLSRAGRNNASPADISTQLAALAEEAGLKNGNQIESKQEKTSPSSSSSSSPTSVEEAIENLNLTPAEYQQLEKRMEEREQEERDNPRDLTKSYMTPWQPRQFLSPFANIPRYLEVNQKICSAVYLRHPVARRGSAEVPTPFPSEISQLAYNWYLRRR